MFPGVHVWAGPTPTSPFTLLCSLFLSIPGPQKLKVNEIRNGRLAMLAFIGFVMGAQVTGKNPLAAMMDHVADPLGTTIFSKVGGWSLGMSCWCACCDVRTCVWVGVHA